MYININKERINTAAIESINKKGLSFTLMSGRIVKVLDRKKFLNLIIASGDDVRIYLEITENNISELIGISDVFNNDTTNGKVKLNKIKDVIVCHQGGPGGEYYISNKRKKELKIKTIFKSEDIDLFEETKVTTDRTFYPFPKIAKPISEL